MDRRGGKRSTSFKPGQSGNPGGKSKHPDAVKQVMADIKQLAKAAAPSAIETLVSVMQSPNSPPAAKVAAAGVLLDRGYGKAPQTIDANVNWSDNLGDHEQRALLSALAAISGDEGRDDLGSHGTHH